MYEGPEFRHLRYFLAVAEECNIGRAAERLNVTQPSLSRQIQQLEDGMGTMLFIRGPSGSGLTARGRELVPFAKKMLDIRAQSVKAMSSGHSGMELPLRFGYSPFLNHDLVSEAMTGFCELVPDGKIDPTSECSGRLASMVLDGHLEAALVTLPIPEKDLYIHKICSERILVCLRRDDPLAVHQQLPLEAVHERLRVMFARAHHPMFYDKILRKFVKAGAELHPSAFVSAPSEMQFLIASGKGLGLLLESTRIPSELILLPIAELPLKITTAFICLQAQQRPVLPLLAYRMAKKCGEHGALHGRKKPVGSATDAMPGKIRIVA